MNISNLRNRKRKLERDILNAAILAVESFKDDTGVSPTSIKIDIINVTDSKSSKGFESLVGDVEVAVKL